MSAPISIDRLVQAYMAIRDARAVLSKRDKEMELDQQRLRAVMLDMLNKVGANSINTDLGTIYRSEKVKPSAADWDAIWTWAKERDAMDIFERRLKATFIKEYMDENDGALPPGVNAHREYEVSVRRPSSPTE